MTACRSSSPAPRCSPWRAGRSSALSSTWTGARRSSPPGCLDRALHCSSERCGASIPHSTDPAPLMSRVLLETTQPAFWDNDAAGRRAIGRIAGILFSAGGLATVPAYRLMENPTPPQAVQLLPLLAFLSGLACFSVPWDRLRAAWFHLVPALGVAEVGLSVWALGAHGNVVSWFFVFVVVFAALAFRERLAVAGHVAFASIVLAAPMA